MRFNNALKTVAAMGALGLAGAASANSLTFQGVTFDVAGSGNTVTLTITNANAATGDWSGATYLNAFQLKGIGGTGATMTSSSHGTWDNYSPNEMNSNGCFGGAGGSLDYCFASLDTNGTPLAAVMTYVFNVSGSPDFSLPSLKVLFSDSSYTKIGSLLSAPVNGTSVPEPATLGLLGLGLAGVGFACRRKVSA